MAVGRCKYSELHGNEEEPNPYQTSSRKEIAFWTAIFGYDLYGEDTDFRSRIEDKYQEWLPPVPEEWQIKNPRVTVLSSGLLTIGVLAATTNAISVGQGMQFNLIPRDWDEEKIAFFQRRFNALGQTWETQPYDLRSRPFDLPNVVPDPYLESRPIKDWNRYDVLENRFENVDNNVSSEGKEFTRTHTRLCMPEENVGEQRGCYRAALGRSFFKTSHGYMGLAPPDARSGDKVVLLDGTRFPFILRQTGSGKNTFTLLGESFMETVVDTEAVETRCKELFVERIAIV